MSAPTITRFYPVVALVLFTILNGILCLFTYSLTAVMFSPAVAHAWERAATKPVVFVTPPITTTSKPVLSPTTTTKPKQPTSSSDTGARK